MITALLVDDEPNALKRLTAMLASYESVEVIGSVRSVVEAKRFLRGRDPDVIFLDITMPGRLGVDLLASVRPRTKVVFVTAKESYAVDAFKAGAVDYVLKPFDDDRLAITIERLEAIFATGRPAVIVRRTMADWEAVLPADQFARISRPIIVQIPRIRSTQWQSRDQMLVFFEGSEEPLPIGRTPMARLKECLQRS